MPNLKTPTLKQKRLVKEYLRTGSAKKAAQIAYPTSKNPSVIAFNNFHKSKVVKEYMRDLMDLAGLKDEDIAATLKKVKDAGTTKEALAMATPKDALQAVKLASELKDLFPAKRVEQKTATMSVSVEGKNETELNDTLNDLAKQIREFQEMVKQTKKINEERKKPEHITDYGDLL